MYPEDFGFRARLEAHPRLRGLAEGVALAAPLLRHEPGNRDVGREGGTDAARLAR